MKSLLLGTAMVMAALPATAKDMTIGFSQIGSKSGWRAAERTVSKEEAKIDVEAHAEIIRLIERLREDGMALLVISSELDEIVTYAEEVIVLRDRAHVARLRGAALSVPAITAAIAGDAVQDAA